MDSPAPRDNDASQSSQNGVSVSAGDNPRLHPEPHTTNLDKSKIGLLSHKIVPSPMIQYVLPARVRSGNQNDVIFIYERSLLIREIIMDTYLEDVTVNSDFDANIIAAKSVKVNQEAATKTKLNIGIEKGLSQEEDDDEGIPSHIMVLTLDSRELIFLYYRSSIPPSDGRFIHFRRALPSDVSISERFGRLLAVDPRSRAIAVAAPSDFFGIFLLKPPDELRSQLKEGTLSPIAEERFFRLEGNILFMEFLHASAAETNKIILLLIVARGRSTYAVYYEWDYAKGTRQSRPRIVTTKLPESCRLPNLLIPLTKSPSYLLVTPSLISIHMNPLGPNPRSRRETHTDTNSKSPSIWAKWARPYRHAEYEKAHDDIYLCREDGRLSYIEIDNIGNIIPNAIGQLECDVDAAFDTIDFNHPGHGGDLLVAAGNTGHGGLFIQIARQDPICVQKFVNWAPVFDTVIVPQLHREAGRNLDMTKDMSEDLHLYVCSASSNNSGAVYELRHGYEAQIGMIIPLDGFATANSAWAIPDLSKEGTYFFISDPVSSAVMHLLWNEAEELYAVDDSDSALDLSAQTLAAGCTSTGTMVQVTMKSVRLMVLGKSEMNAISEFPTDQTALVATVNGELGLVATDIRSEQGITIQVGRIRSENDSVNIDFLKEIVNVDYEPISILIEAMKDATYVFVGSSEGCITYYRVEENNVVYAGRYALDLPGDHISKAIESIALVDRVGSDGAAMYCGLRSGLLVPIDLRVNTQDSKDSISMKQQIEKRFGQTVIKLLRDGRIILATCGIGFWCISDISISNASDFELQRIWITDQNDSTYTQKSIEVFTILDLAQTRSTTNLGGSLACISDGQLLICSLDHRAKAVPRKVELPGIVNRIHYSDYLKCLVIAYITTELETETETNIVKRYMRPRLNFLNFDTSLSHLLSYQHNLQSPNSPPSQKPVGSSGERITCIIDWVPESGGQRYHFLVIGTARKTHEQKGRVIFIYARRNATNFEQIDSSVKYIHSFDGPVRAVAAYGNSTVMVAAGNDIIPVAPKLPNGGKQWAAAARFKLTSPGVSITVRDTFLYVSTARESLVILQVVDNKLELYAQDGVRHESLSHQYIGGDHKLILVSHRGGTISAFSEVGITATDKIISPAIAEAQLPVSIIRLHIREDVPFRLSTLPSSTVEVYGTTMDGAIYRILTINEKEWRLLRFIQNLCSKDQTLSPFLSARKRRWTWADIEPQAKKPSSMHVDGDILVRVIQQGIAHLRNMLLSDKSSAQANSLAVPPPKTYMELFSELFGETFADTPIEGDPMDYFMCWLQKLLHHRH